MHPIIQKTFGGLAPSYYFRHFVFGLIFPAMFFFAMSRSPNPQPLAAYVILVVNTLLYPYARFVYEGVVGFFMGDTVLIVNLFLMLFVKVMTMAVCWGGALFIAPIGLLYLFIHHSRAARG
ncbi:hypothetical protein [Piscinibacter terrae]|uniref:Uncharacterized protein n=1 Tax=Piscinibacter terrae TaxID=2496871 RepID=A0A3N7IUF3_9BURK|nr:hypothetical protein [Albitalea terrae]RQP22462.1 hypothetical protein DZC73_22735 [Albitalea terrae]